MLEESAGMLLPDMVRFLSARSLMPAESSS